MAISNCEGLEASNAFCWCWAIKDNLLFLSQASDVIIYHYYYMDCLRPWQSVSSVGNGN